MRTALRALPYFLLALFLFPATALAGTSVAGQARVAIDSASHTSDFSTTASRDSVVVLHEWERDKMLALKSANPSIKVLMYKNLSFMQTRSADGNASTGVTTQDAAAHPDWYLLNKAGAHVIPRNFSWMSAADLGNRSYQDTWARNVLARLNGWDGVFVDDTNPTMKYHYAVDQVAKYPSDAAYAASTGSALSVIGPKLRAAGKLVIPNFGSWGSYRSTVDPWLQYVSGGMEEQFGKWGTDPAVGYVTGNAWRRQLEALKATQSAGKLFVGISHSQATDAKAARYGWATTLLGAGGKAAFAMAADYTNETTTFPEYGYDIGEPTGAETGVDGGVHRRAFQRGLVLVNPTTAPLAVSFGGTYSGSGLKGATGATLAPSSALILTRDGAAAAHTAATSADDSSGSDDASTSPNTEVLTGSMADIPSAAAGDDGDAVPVADGATVRRSGHGLRVKVRCHSRSSACRMRVTVRLHGASVGRRLVKVPAAAAKTFSVRLNGRGSAALASQPASLRVVLKRAR